MTEDKKPSVASTIKNFFGYKPDQTLTEFMGELKALSPEDKTQLAEGINNGSLTY